jgi:hypothetical protein
MGVSINFIDTVRMAAKVPRKTHANYTRSLRESIGQVARTPRGRGGGGVSIFSQGCSPIFARVALETDQRRDQVAVECGETRFAQFKFVAGL